MKSTLTFLSCIALFSHPSFAGGGKASPLEINGLDSSKNPIHYARVDQIEVLTQKYTDPDNLKVTLLVETLGGYDDGKNNANLYLATYGANSSTDRGAKDGQSVHKISGIRKLISYQKIRTGVYEAYYSTYEATSPCGGPSIVRDIKATIYAERLTTDVLSPEDTNASSPVTVTTPIGIEYKCL